MIAASSSPRQIPAEFLLALGALVVAVSLALLLSTLGTAVAIIFYLGVIAAVLIDGRSAYFLLPITIPWGSAIALPGAHVPFTVSDVVVGALVASWIVQSVISRRFTFAWSAWIGALAALLLAMIASCFFAASLTASAKEVIKWLELLLVAGLAPTYLRTSRDVFLVLVSVTVGAVSQSCMGLGQFVTHSGPKAFDIHGRFLRAYGTFGQPNPLAGYLNMVLPVVAAAALALRSRLFAAAAIVTGLCSIATLSRAGWVAGTLAVTVVILIYIPPLRRLAMLGLVAVPAAVLAALFGIVPISPFTKVATSFGLTGINFSHHTHANFSEIERAAHWVAGIRMFESHPFLGVGIGNYSTVYQAFHVASFSAPLGHAHNYFINIAAEAGIVGLLAYTLFVMTGFLAPAQLLKRVDHRSLAGVVSVGLLGLWASATFHNLFDVLYVHELTLLIAVLMGVLFALVGRAADRAAALAGPAS